MLTRFRLLVLLLGQLFTAWFGAEPMIEGKLLGVRKHLEVKGGTAVSDPTLLLPPSDGGRFFPYIWHSILARSCLARSWRETFAPLCQAHAANITKEEFP